MHHIQAFRAVDNFYPSGFPGCNLEKPLPDLFMKRDIFKLETVILAELLVPCKACPDINIKIVW